jgi:hypothetical protein
MLQEEEKNYETELSPETLAALNTFLLKRKDTKMENEDEDWSLAQFWYTDETRDVLAKEALKMSSGGSIAVVSAPSIFFKLSELKVSNRIVLFEYDKRFEEEFGKENFCFYDCDYPQNIPGELHHSFDFVFGDPPRLFILFLFFLNFLGIKTHVPIFIKH